MELDKPRDEVKEKQFYRFVKLLDKQRKLYIGDWLKEWDKYFKDMIL